MGIFSILLEVLFFLNIILAAFIIFLERRNPSTTWAWLMILVFIPVLGFILYLIFGQNLTRRRMFTWLEQEKIGIKTQVNQQIQTIKDGSFPFESQEAAEFKDHIYMQLVNNDALFTQKNEVTVFTDGWKKFEALIEDIKQARDHIHVQYYIFREDGLGNEIIEALTQKVEQGIKVRVLYDHMGSRGNTKRFFKTFREAGGLVEAFFPFLHYNYRNHRKLVIIDGAIGYIGGFNVGDEYLGLDPRFGYWRDTHLRISGKAVHALQTRFILDWNQASKKHDITYDDCYFPKVAEQGDVGIQIVSSGPDSEWEQIKNGYVKMIFAAKHYIHLQTPYFIPDDTLLDAMRIVALSGVDVRIMIPNKPDHMFVYWATFFNIGELLKAGVKVYIYQNGFIHAKTIIVDDKLATVGTANVDVRSFRLNFEVNAFLFNQKQAEGLREVFEKDMDLSTQLTLEDYRNRSLYIKIKESISRLLSPIL